MPHKTALYKITKRTMEITFLLLCWKLMFRLEFSIFVCFVYEEKHKTADLFNAADITIHRERRVFAILCYVHSTVSTTLIGLLSANEVRTSNSAGLVHTHTQGYTHTLSTVLVLCVCVCCEEGK